MPDDGGLAYPYACTVDIHRAESMGLAEKGMSLLDHFAGEAMNGILAAQSGLEPEDLMDESHCARIAYHTAHAMIAEKRRLEAESKP